MGIKVYKEGYQVVIDDPSKDDKVYKTAYFTRFGFDGDNVWIKELDYDNLIFLNNVYIIEDSAGSTVGGKEAVETYLLSFIGQATDDASQLSTILFNDRFDGEVINTGKWTVAEPNTARVEITQDDELIFTTKAIATESTFLNYLVTSAIDISTLQVISFDILKGAENTNLWSIGLNEHNPPLQTDYIVIQKSNIEDNIWLRIRDINVPLQQEDVVVDIETTIQSFKIIIDTDIKYYHWSSGAWGQIGTTYAAHGLTGNYYPFVSMQDSTTATNLLNVDNFYVTDTDFSTQHP